MTVTALAHAPTSKLPESPPIGALLQPCDRPVRDRSKAGNHGALAGMKKFCRGP